MAGFKPKWPVEIRFKGVTVIRFNLNGHWVEESKIDPNWTVLRYLRTKSDHMAAKEGCAGGDCGACSILIGERGTQNQIHFKTVNACIALLGSLDGQYVVTVEGLRDGEQLHPVQQAMVDHHGSQCGFCTPGIISSLAALYHNRHINGEQGAPCEHDIHVALSGNLCRCTGYRPIIEAAKHMHSYPAPIASAPVMNAGVGIYEPTDSLNTAANNTISPSLEHEGRKLFVPDSEDQLKQLLTTHPQARLWAGGTDLGLEITQQFKQFDTLISLHKVQALTAITEDETSLRFGAMVTYSNAEQHLTTHFPSFAQLVERIGSRQVRNLGTLGGNIANASPIGDTPPVFFALNARIEVGSAAGHREVAIEDFVKGYKQTDLKPGEYLRSIVVPKLTSNQMLNVYKVSKRKEDDISAVLMATRIEHHDGVIKDVRIACGGMAATPLRAKHTEATLIGQSFTLSSFEQAAKRIKDDYQPINDVRATAEYRLMVAANLVIKTGLACLDEQNQSGGK